MNIAPSEMLRNVKPLGIVRYTWTTDNHTCPFTRLFFSINLLCILYTWKIPLRFAEPIRHANTLFPHTFILLDKHALMSQIFGGFAKFKHGF